MTPQQLARVVSTFALSEEQLARLFATWDESKHPRGQGGKWIEVYHGTTAKIGEQIRKEGLKPKGRYKIAYVTDRKSQAQAYAAVRENESPRRGDAVLVTIRVPAKFWRETMKESFTPGVWETESTIPAKYIRKVELLKRGRTYDFAAESTNEGDGEIELYVVVAVDSDDVQAAFATWDEAKHPRHGAGSDQGGEFAPSESPALDSLVSGLDLSSGPKTLGAVKVLAYRVGPLSDPSGGRGIFFGDSPESIADYEGLHPGHKMQRYEVSAKKAIAATGHHQLYKHLFGGTLQDAVWNADKASGFKSSVVAFAKMEVKMARALRAKGYDAIVYTSPPAPAKHEIVLLQGASGVRAYVLDYAARRPLYVRRDVLNAAEIIDWAKANGFATTLAPEDMHVTCCYSKRALNWDKIEPSYESVRLEDSKGRTVEALGDEGAVVLKFQSLELQDRFTEFLNAGATWDYPEYNPHITITYQPPKGLDVPPYEGTIVLGPEIFEEIDEEFAETIVEYDDSTFDPNKHPRHDAGTPGGKGGEFAPKQGEAFDTKTAETFRDLSEWENESFGTKPISYSNGTELQLGKVYSDKIKAAIAVALGDRLAQEPAAQEFVKAVHDAGYQIVNRYEIPNDAPNADYRKIAATIVSTWAATSGDSNPLSITMQKAVHDEFNLKARIDHFGISMEQAYDQAIKQMVRHSGGASLDGDISSLIPGGKEKMYATMKVFARQMHNETQADLKAQGIKELHLYRGVKMSVGHRYSGTIGAFRNTELQPASSFSSSFYTAAAFGSTTMMVKVPASRVLGTWRTGFGCQNEEEVVLLGGRINTLWATKKNVKKNSVVALHQAAVTHVKPKTPTKVKTPVTQFAAEDEARDVITPDEDLYNADWPKRTWDLPFEKGSAEYEEWLRETPGAAMLPVVRGYAEWNEAKHPRHPEGSDKGGEFASANDSLFESLSDKKVLSRPDGEALMSALDAHGWNPRRLGKHADNMRKAFDLFSVPLPQDTMLYRGLSLTPEQRQKLTEALDAGKKPSLKHKHFVPTSASKRMAEDFGNVLLRVRATKGTKVLAMGGIGVPEFRKYKELTLNSGSKLSIKSYKKYGERLVLEAEIQR
jgi:hypothetical protein